MVGFFDISYSLQQWQAIGIFDILIPFFLIFAIIFAILQKTQLFKSGKAVDAIVAMSFAVLALLNPFVTELMKIILQNTVIAVLIMVSLMLIFGLMLGSKKPAAWNFFSWIIGAIIAVWLLGRVADYYELYTPGTTLFSTNWWNSNLPWIIPVLLIVVFAIIIISSGGESKPKNSLQYIMKQLTEPTKDSW
jgi:hypothetical protein